MKYIFLGIVLIAAAAIYLRQRSGPPALEENWPRTLDAALAQAEQTDRRVLVFFTSEPPSETTRRLVDTTLARPENRRAIQEGNFIRARAILDVSLDSPAAKKYRIRRLPTMMVLSPEGKELNRREGFIGEVPFRSGFLDLEEIQEPAPAE